MTAQASTSQTSLSINDLDAILGKRPILPNESSEAYDKLTYQFRMAVDPQDFVEEILVRDAIDLTWEIQRLKDFKKQLLHSEREGSLKALLLKLLGHGGYAENLYKKWQEGDKAAIKSVNDLLYEKGLDPSAIDAFSFKAQLDNIDRYDRLIMQAEERRVAHLREVDRHRVALAAIMRDTIEAVEDGKTIEHEAKK